MMLPDASSAAPCRICSAPVHHTFVDLGMSPLCESYLRPDQLNEMEAFYPLHVFVCERCFLVQLQEYVRPEAIFSEYAYFSSYSDAWLEHARRYTDGVVERFGLDAASFVIELASNDGYLLRNFVARGIPAVGIEPAANIAEVAIRQGVRTRVAFFGRTLAEEIVHEGAHVHAYLRPQRLVVGLEDDPLCTAKQTLLEVESEPPHRDVLPLRRHRIRSGQSPSPPRRRQTLERTRGARSRPVS